MKFFLELTNQQSKLWANSKQLLLAVVTGEHSLEHVANGPVCSTAGEADWLGLYDHLCSLQISCWVMVSQWGGPTRSFDLLLQSQTSFLEMEKWMGPGTSNSSPGEERAVAGVPCTPCSFPVGADSSSSVWAG